MTVLAFGNSAGTQRCDSRCYEAEHPKCRCICGGVNHGKGVDEAMVNSFLLAGQWLRDSEFTEILPEGIFAPPARERVLRELVLRAPKRCARCGGLGLLSDPQRLCPQCGGSGDED